MQRGETIVHRMTAKLGGESLNMIFMSEMVSDNLVSFNHSLRRDRIQTAFVVREE